MQNPKPSFEATALAELPVLYRVARRMTRDAATAEDLVGQTLLKAATAWEAFDGRYARSWMIRIMHNARSREMSKLESQLTHVALDDITASSEDVWNDLDTRMLSASIVEELDRLPEEYRLAVTLCDMEELSYEEASVAMSVPVGTVRSRLYRGRMQLRQRLSHLCQESDPK
jgi:RNA polymerase sigma-70 factor (ECF subfamily)